MTAQTNNRIATLFQRKRDPVTFTQIVTPEDAAAMIETMRYEHQRPLRPGRVRAYADEMAAGTFRELTQIFIAVYQGRHVILDGQHRLSAVKASGVPILFTIVEKDVENDEELAKIYSTTDIGTRRTPSDIYGAYALVEEFDLDKTTIDRLGAAIKFMMTGCIKNGEQARPDTIIPYMRLYAPQMQAYRAIIDECTVANALWSPVRRSSTVALALLTLRFSAPKAEKEGRPPIHEFWTGALQDDGLKIGDPRKVAHRHLNETRIQAVNTTRANQITTTAYSIRYLGNCVNAYIKGESIRGAKVFNGTAPIAVYGVPSDPAKWW